MAAVYQTPHIRFDLCRLQQNSDSDSDTETEASRRDTASIMSDKDRDDRKREYNRNAQREFRRRRKEHLKNLEQLQREQSTDKSEEIDRLRQQIEALTRENDDLKSQMYSSYSPSMSSDSRFQSMTSLGQYETTHAESLISSIAMAGPSVMATSPMLHSGNLGYMPGQNPGMPRSPSEVSSLSGSRSGQGTSTGVTLQENFVVLVPCDRNVARQELRDMFSPILNPAVYGQPQLHLNALANLSASLPKSLRPTAMQLQTPHYFGVDFLPSPSLRERLIGVGHEVSQNFISEVFNILDDSTDAGQVTIWGDDYTNEMAWEISAPMLSRWGWLLGRDWASRTNFWRRQRGASLLNEADYFG